MIRPPLFFDASHIFGEERPVLPEKYSRKKRAVHRERVALEERGRCADQRALAKEVVG